MFAALNSDTSNSDFVRQHQLLEERFQLEMTLELKKAVDAGANCEDNLKFIIAATNAEIERLEEAKADIQNRTPVANGADQAKLVALELEIDRAIECDKQLVAAANVAQVQRPAAVGGAAIAQLLWPIVQRKNMDQETVKDKNGNNVTIYGQPDSSSTTPGHAETIEAKARELADSGLYGKILMGRSWRTATNREADSKNRPDIIAIGRDGKVHAWEVPSASDTDRGVLEQRLSDGRDSVPDGRRGRIRIEPIPPNYKERLDAIRKKQKRGNK